MRRMLSVFTSLAVFVLLLVSSQAYAAKNADVVTFSPTTDGGRFVTQHQSGTLGQWRFNVGTWFNYEFESLEFVDPTGVRQSGIVDDFIMAQIGGAIGVTDWWDIGVNFPVALWETFYNPNVAAALVNKQNLYGKLADPRLEMKFRLLDIERYRVGLALVPYLYFPLGKEEFFMGNGMWSPGGKFVLDFDIKNRVFLTLNTGYRVYNFNRYDNNNADAIINDTFTLGGGISVRLTDSWHLLGEIWQETVIENFGNAFFRNHLQNPAEFVAGARWMPQGRAKGLAVTLGGGRGLTTGIGSPEFSAFLGVNFRKPAVVELPEPVEVEAIVEEKIVITQKIHFEFDSAKIREISNPILDDVAMLLKLNPQIAKVRVEGHTDWIGADKYNQELSEKRAGSVRDYLIEKGIEPDRLEAVGFGESGPIADNNTTRGRARNRRTEFTVVE